MRNQAENERKPMSVEQTPAGDARNSAPASSSVAGASASALLWMRIAGIFPAGIPFFFTLPYTVKSWRISPMDRWNWIFFLAFLLLAACAAPAAKDSAKRNRPDCFALLAVAAAAVLYGTGLVRQIHMIQILAGTWLWWAGAWFLCGWPGAWAALPAFAALSLGATSTTFVLCNLFHISPQTALFLKIGGAVLCAAGSAFFLLTDFVMKREVFWFLLAAAAILTGTIISRGGALSAPPFRPDLTAAPEGFTNTEIPPTQDQIRFFEGAEIHQYRISDGVFRCSVLEVKCGDDIHKIHPASHCLRSGGAVIESESVVMHTLPDGRELPVTEIHSRTGGVRTLTFVWYTGPEETVGGFYSFRRKWRASDQWRSYQIVTEIFNGNEAAARKFLLEVLSKF